MISINKSSPSHALPGSDDITRVQLANGIVILSRANFNSPSVVIRGYLPAGGIFDPDDKLGLADFTATALMRGTTMHSFQEIYDRLESSGASLGIGCATHTINFHGKSLVEDLNMLIGTLTEVLRNPTFPIEQVQRLKSQLLTSLAIRAQDTGDMASLTFDQIVYRDHPYSRPEDGYPETIEAISQSDLAAFHQSHYGPRGMVISVVGGIDPTKAVEQVGNALEDWLVPDQAISPKPPFAVPLEKTIRQDVLISGKSQADIVLGAAGPTRRSPEYYAASLGNNILGSFGMMGRVGEAVREQAGLAYYAGSNMSGGLGPGPWYVSAGVAPHNIEQAIALIIEEIRRFTSEQVSQDELSDSQANYIGSLPLALESNVGVASVLTNIERYELDLDHYRRYEELVRSVTPSQVLETAQRYLDPQRLGIAVAGPGDNP
jgi:zinc protease